MGNLDNLQNLITNLSAYNWQTALENAVDSGSDRLAELQRQQLATGKDADGNPSLATRGSDEYSMVTKAMKKGKSGLAGETGFVTNFNTSALYNGLEKKREGTLINTNSPVSYFAERKAESSKSEFELNPENRLDFAENDVMPFVGDDFKSKTGLVISKV